MISKHGVLVAAVLGTAAGAAGLGCGGHEHHEPRERAVPVGYVYEPGYYDRGYYRDNEWYWHDRDGRSYHELREDHERRMQGWDGRRGDGGGGEQRGREDGGGGRGGR